MTIVLRRAQQHLLEHGVRDAVLDQDLAFRHGTVAAGLPGLGLGHALVPELLRRRCIAPVSERALGNLHDVPLVDQGDGRAGLVEGMAQGSANQSLGTRCGDRLDADPGILPNLGAHPLVQELDDLTRLASAAFPLDARIDILGVLPKDNHIQFAGSFIGRARPDTTSRAARRHTVSGSAAMPRSGCEYRHRTGVVRGPLMATLKARIASTVSAGNHSPKRS